MKLEWKLYYNDSSDMPQFAEVMQSEKGTTIRKGRIFTHGTITQISDLKQELKGFELKHEWIYDTSDPDFSQFEKILDQSCQREHNGSNALAIYTDSSVMTIGLILHNFDDIETTDDDQLWIADEWSNWLNDRELDPAYRWLLAYGFNNEDDSHCFEEFRDKVITVMQRCLTRLPPSVPVRLIYVGGDDFGHRRSIDCMERSLSDRIQKWLGM